MTPRSISATIKPLTPPPTHAEIEYIPLIEDYEAGTNDNIFQQAQMPRMKASYNKNTVIQHCTLKDGDTYLSPVDNYNLGPRSSCAFCNHRDRLDSRKQLLQRSLVEPGIGQWISPLFW